MREVLIWLILMLILAVPTYNSPEAWDVMLQAPSLFWSSVTGLAIFLGGIAALVIRLIDLGTIRTLEKDLDFHKSRIEEKNEKLEEAEKKNTDLLKQIEEKDVEITNLKKEQNENDVTLEPVYAFYNKTFTAIRDEGVQVLTEVRKVNKEKNPDIINSPMPCTIERLDQVLDIDRENINELVGELKKLDLVSSQGDSDGYANSHVKDGDHYPLFITERGRTFLFMHKLKNR